MLNSIKSFENFLNKKFLKEGEETRNYMFFSNLKSIKRIVDSMLEMSEAEIDSIISNGHDWASDHVSTSRDDLEEVYNFLTTYDRKEKPNSFVKIGSSHIQKETPTYEKRNQINELNKETWLSAANKASSKGYSKLADEFINHSKQYGTSNPQKEFEMVFKKREGEVNLKLRLISLKSGWGGSFDMIAEDESGKQYNIAVNNFGGFPKFYLDGEWDGLALNRKEAKKLLDVLKENGIDVTSDTRSISYEHVKF